MIKVKLSLSFDKMILNTYLLYASCIDELTYTYFRLLVLVILVVIVMGGWASLFGAVSSRVPNFVTQVAVAFLTL